MKKQLSILFIWLLLPVLGMAQVKVTLGQPYPVIDADYKYYFNRGSEILALKMEKREITMQKFNAELVCSKINIFRDLPKGYTLENIVEYNDRYFLFYSLWNKSEERAELLYREIDFDKASFKGEDKVLVGVSARMMGFQFQFSKNDEKMLVHYRLKPEIKNDSKSFDIIGMHVFGKNLEPIWHQEVRMPYTEKKMNNLDYSIDGQGNAYILTTVYDDNTTDSKKRREEKANYHIELLKVTKGTDEVKVTQLSLGNKFINRIYLYELTDDNMIIAGFYNNSNDYDAVNGVFLFKLTKEGKLSEAKSYEIPLEILNMYVGEREQRRNEKKEGNGDAEFQNLELSDLRVGADGSIVLVGEQFIIESHTYYNPSTRTTTTYYTYHYNDMLVTKIDPNGKLAWMKKLPKRQSGGASRGGMSYKYMFSGNSHYLLFLDNEKNMELSTDKYPAVHKDGAGGFLTAYKIDDSTGKVEKISILDTKDVEGLEVFQFQTNRIMSTKDNQFVVEVYKKKKQDVLIKVDLGK